MGWAKYEGKPLQVHATEDTKSRIRKIAEDEGVSQASVVRDIIDAGLTKREALSERKLAKKEATRG